MMIEEYIINYILLYIILEIFEVAWQKAHTLIGVLSRMHHYYNKSIFLFLIMHPTFYFSIIFMLLTNFNIYATIPFMIKGVDIASKMVFIKQIFIDKEIYVGLEMVLLTPIKNIYLYLGLIVYPPLIYMALV